ncbi:MAG TPA: DUF3473 domain-containing protein [bacterium]|nr:DUF3473 domain-containing protein [bacterium]
MSQAKNGYVNALTIDVEDYFHVGNFSPYIKVEQWDNLEEVAPQATYRILRLLEENGVRATFFTLGWLAKRHPRLVRAIHASGHEVACHGYFHEPLTKLHPDEFRADIRAAKRLLEDTVGTSVRGFRAPSFSINESNLWTFDVLIEEGFEYDSSLYPGRLVPFGFAGAFRHPHNVDRGTGGLIKELPMATLKMFGVKLPFAGGGHFRLYPYWMIRRGIRRINQNERAPVVVYFHPWEIVPSQPRIKASLRASIKHYLGLGAMEYKITHLLRDFNFVPAAELLDHFRL